MVPKPVLDIEEDLWLGGPDVYRRHLADDAVVVVPGAVLDRSATIDSIARGPRWSQVERHDVRCVELCSDVVLITYQAQARREGAEEYRAVVSSAYGLVDGQWYLRFHQQTPVPA